MSASKVQGQALTLLSDGGPIFVCRALSEETLNYQDFRRRHPYEGESKIEAAAFRDPTAMDGQDENAYIIVLSSAAANHRKYYYPHFMSLRILTSSFQVFPGDTN